jgi:hypothetical protein
MKMNKIFLALVAMAAVLTSCENQDITYPDFDYQTVYFANQYPVRTVELGDDMLVDNTLDNQKKVEIKATMGGVYANKTNIEIDFKVDTSLCTGMYFVTSNLPVVPMPAAYYQLKSNKITIPSASVMGGVEVQLTDAFFNDPKSLTNTYVIPLLMTDVNGADSILQGSPLVASPNRCIDAHWSIKPRDFVLYAVKYVNPWAGNYLRRGADQITNPDGSVTTTVRRKEYVENDEVAKITTNSLTVSTLPISVKDNAGKTVTYNLKLTFSDDVNCTIGGSDATYEITGSGKFVSKGEKNSFGGKDRNVLYLDYNVTFKATNLKYASKDTLVVRDRGIAPEYFTVVKK